MKTKPLQILIENKVQVEGDLIPYSFIRVANSSIEALVESSSLLDQSACRKALINAGLNPNLPTDFGELFSTAVKNATETSRKVATRVGWHEDEYVLPETTISPRKVATWVYRARIGREVLPPSGSPSKSLRKFIRRHYHQSAPLTLVACAAFVGPVLDLLEEQDGFGLYMNGETSSGKSSLLRMAKALTQPVATRLQQFNFTQRGSEELFFSRNDNLCCLDEIGAMDLKDLPQIVYRMANGTGRRRSSAPGISGEFPHLSWRTIVLVSGEPEVGSLPNRRRQSGQDVRLIGIKVPSNTTGGIFGSPSSQATKTTEKLVKKLENACARYNGNDLHRWIEALVHNREGMREKLSAATEVYFSQLAGDEANSMLRRLARKFAILAATGAVLSEMKIIRWKPDLVFKLIAHLYREQPGTVVQPAPSTETALKTQATVYARTLISKLAASARFHDLRNEKCKTDSKKRLGIIKIISDEPYVAVHSSKISEAFDVVDVNLLVQSFESIPNLVLRLESRNSVYYQIQHSIDGISVRENFLTLNINRLARLSLRSINSGSE